MRFSVMRWFRREDEAAATARRMKIRSLIAHVRAVRELADQVSFRQQSLGELHKDLFPNSQDADWQEAVMRMRIAVEQCARSSALFERALKQRALDGAE